MEDQEHPEIEIRFVSMEDAERYRQVAWARSDREELTEALQTKYGRLHAEDFATEGRNSESPLYRLFDHDSEEMTDQERVEVAEGFISWLQEMAFRDENPLANE